MFSLFYNLNGIPSTTVDGDSFWVQESIAGFILKDGDNTFDIDATCIRLRDQLAIKIFDSLQTYHTLLPAVSMAYPYGGIDAEVNVPKEEFEKFVNSGMKNKTHNQLLYFYDVANVIGTLQNAVLESKHLLGQFYKTLNLNSFLAHEETFVVDDGIQYGAGPIVTSITSTVNHLFINLYSQLDFLTKIANEFQHLQTDFTTYPRLKCKDVLYGDAKRLKINGTPGSIFEASEDINKIIALRNEIVHNSSIDSIPKVYQVIEKKKIIEKYLLLPDFEKGYIKSFKNRRRFFSEDTKLNTMLPGLMTNFWVKVKTTLDAIK